MPKSGTFGSVRGVPSNGHPYRDRCAWRRTGFDRGQRYALPTAESFAHMPTAFNYVENNS